MTRKGLFFSPRYGVIPLGRRYNTSMNIRTLTPADLPAIRVVSRKASLHQDRTPEQWALAALKYVDYYPCHAGDTSLALELEDGSFAGYVLCAPDADAYFQTLEQEYRPQIETLSPGSYAPFLEAQSYIREFAREYPAHLHINVVPEAQNLRAGSRLMQALLKRLKEKGIPGVCLGVDSSRKQAVHFYEKNGFTVLRDAGDTLFMGRRTD